MKKKGKIVKQKLPYEFENRKITHAMRFHLLFVRLVAIFSVVTKELDERLHLLQENILALWLDSLLWPINNGGIRDDILLVQESDDLAVELGQLGILVAAELHLLQQDDLRLGRVGECLEDSDPFLCLPVCDKLKTKKKKKQSILSLPSNSPSQSAQFDPDEHWEDQHCQWRQSRSSG